MSRLSMFVSVKLATYSSEKIICTADRVCALKRGNLGMRLYII